MTLKGHLEYEHDASISATHSFSVEKGNDQRQDPYLEQVARNYLNIL